MRHDAVEGALGLVFVLIVAGFAVCFAVAAYVDWAGFVRVLAQVGLMVVGSYALLFLFLLAARWWPRRG